MATVNHRIKGPFVKTNTNGLVGKIKHIAHISKFPLNPIELGMTLGHEADNRRGEIDTELLFVTTGRKLNRNEL